MDDLTAAAITEIQELHVEFEQWFGGESDSLDRVESVLLNTFTMVTPNGETVARNDLIEGLKEAHGAVELTIEIKNTTVRWEGADGMLVSYEEWQTTPDNSNARQSTVLFEHDWGAPNGLKWAHVHETWMPEGS
ncbi:MAG: DUF4440 domain-containing protein [Acidimicrobiales bacterium]|nr:DUF4440 domain-containing protein [Acidimicrobiales bacterium]